MLSGDESLFALAEKSMRAFWGDIDLASEVMTFNFTDYYEKQMGTQLLRKFVSFAGPIDPGRLADIKHATNDLEAQLAQSRAGLAFKAARPINLDPGYITLGKLVLASTKDYSHRIYIGQSMYAEPTLRFSKGTWHSWPFTYPDYGSGNYFEFLSQSRKRLQEQLSSLKENT